jgi:signal transduction histidine kinase
MTSLPRTHPALAIWRELVTLLRRPRMALTHIRVRLTLWYVLILAITLCTAGAAFYAFVSNEVNSRLQTDLAMRAHRLAEEARVGLTPNGQIAVVFPLYIADDNGSGLTLAVLFNQNGQAVAANVPDLETLQLPPQVVAAALNQQPVFWRIRDAQGQQFEFYVFTPDRTNFPAPLLAVGQPLTEEERTLTMVAVALLAGIPLALAIAALGGFWLATQALRPVDELTRTAEAISASDLSRRVPIPGAARRDQDWGKQRTCPRPVSTGDAPLTPSAAPAASAPGQKTPEAIPNDELSRLANAFNAMLVRLEAAFEQQRRFTADASHELRTPLAAILAQTSITLRRRRQPEEYERALRSIQSETERLSRLVDGLLTLARLDAHAPPASPHASVDLLALAEEALAHYQGLATQRGVTMTLESPPPEAASPTVRGDRDQLQQVVLNVLDNALKFTPAGGNVWLRVFIQDNAALIQIRDTGHGVAPEELAHLTERFYQGDAARTAGQGSGLGLAICQAIITAHGGTLTITSPGIGQGTQVTIALPRQT